MAGYKLFLAYQVCDMLYDPQIHEDGCITKRALWNIIDRIVWKEVKQAPAYCEYPLSVP